MELAILTHLLDMKHGLTHAIGRYVVCPLPARLLAEAGQDFVSVEGIG